MKIVSPQTRYAALILLVALVASLLVAAFRFNVERHANQVEIAMDYNDFNQLARSYDYKPEGFLVALRRAGLTSLALTEELGSDLADSPHASVISGTQLLAQARLSRIADPALAALVRAGKVHDDTIYLTVYDQPTYERYRAMLPVHFDAKSISIVRATNPWIIAVRTQIDYFNTVSLGIPSDQLALARHLGLEIIPRFQNDERYQLPQMRALIASLHGTHRVSTLIFFGLRNQVLGYPDNLDGMAQVFNENRFNFGTIEIYDQSQLQKGSDKLAAMIPGRTVRVQAIAKTELDKLRFDEVVSRYVLGVRERNIRVVYLRPFAHEYNGQTIEATNVAMVKAIADEIQANGFSVYPIRPATPIPLYRGNSAILVGLAALGVPSIFVLLLGIFGWNRRWIEIAAYAVTILVYLVGWKSHHYDLIARSVIALIGALLFSAAAFLVLARAFAETPPPSTREQILRSLKWTLIAVGVALLGALLVVGIMSSPLTMTEVERFRGVKAILALPPLIALALYIFSGRYATETESASEVWLTPVRAWHLLVLALVAVAGALLLMRSGNQSDVGASSFELSLRHGLTSVLNVRPRFKLFLVGVPLLMLTPALVPAHRRAAGWLLALGIGVGIGDVIDTFSHLHTALWVSMLRIGNGVLLGALIGIVLIYIYRAIVRRRSSAP